MSFWLWLAGTDGFSARNLDGLKTRDVSIVDELLALQRLSPRQAENLRQAWRAETWRRTEEECRRLAVTMITWDDEDYPEPLRRIAEPPVVLFSKGAWPDLTSSVAVVGTRRCSEYGRHVARRLGETLAERQVPVISGGATGIDGAAHSGAIDGKGPTVAVLGSGLDRLWPSGHRELFEAITSSGCLVSEYAPSVEARPWRFPRRNRIIAGLCRHLVVVESPRKGGSMITARLAMEEGRELWAVPGRIDEKICEGSNSLLAEGTAPLVDLTGFLEQVTGLGQLELFSTQPCLTQSEQVVFDALRREGDLTADQLGIRTELSATDLLTALTSLHIKDLTYSSPGGRWRAVVR